MGVESEVSHWRGRGDCARVCLFGHFLDLVYVQFLWRIGVVLYFGLETERKIIYLYTIVDVYTDI